MDHGNRAGVGRVHAVRLAIHNAANDADVEAAARRVGIYSEYENAHQYLTPEVHGHNATLVMNDLIAHGFDGAAVTDIPMSGDGAPFTSWAIFRSDQVTATQSARPGILITPAPAPRVVGASIMERVPISVANSAPVVSDAVLSMQAVAVPTLVETSETNRASNRRIDQLRELG